MGKIRDGLIGAGLIVLGALEGYHLYKNTEHKDMVRDIYFRNLPIESVIITNDKTFNHLYARITEGAPDENRRPTREEFGRHALEMNPEFSANDLWKSFGGKVQELDLPNYDYDCNNGRFCE